MTTKYILEILEPRSAGTKLASFQSATPFSTLALGSTINPIAEARAYNEELVVSNSETRIWVEADSLVIKTIVFTSLKSKASKAIKSLWK